MALPLPPLPKKDLEEKPKDEVIVVKPASGLPSLPDLPLPPSRLPAPPASQQTPPGLPLPSSLPDLSPPVRPSHVKEEVFPPVTTPAHQHEEKPSSVLHAEPPRVQRATRIEELPAGWRIDPKTGVKFRELLPNDPEAAKSFKRDGGRPPSLEQLRKYSEEIEDFDIEDLNSTAQNFLGHLRVTSSNEEKEIAILKRKQNAEFKRLIEAEAQMEQEENS